MTRMPKRWWKRKLPADAATKTDFSTKTKALRVFIERNRGVIDHFGGEDAVHRPAEFDAINHELNLRGTKQITTIAEALWLSLSGGPPWRLQDINVALLNGTAPGQYVGGFRYPDQVHDQVHLHAGELHYEAQGIDEGLVDQCFDRFRHVQDGTFGTRGKRLSLRGLRRERACVCREGDGQFETCSLRSAETPSTQNEPAPPPPEPVQAWEAAPEPRPLNAYEEKQEARRERLEQRAANAEARSNAAYSASRGATAGSPMGQPILVGHHSERRHRADLARSDRAMRKSIDEQERAEEFRARAAGVGKGGISSDDPDAITKLTTKLAELEAKREQIKQYNRGARKAGKEKAPAYILANLGGNIRRYRERIKLLEAQRAAPERSAIDGDGFRIWEDKEQNRLLFRPDERISKTAHKQFRSAGFVYSKANGAYQRKISNGARYEAERLATELFGWVKGVPF